MLGQHEETELIEFITGADNCVKPYQFLNGKITLFICIFLQKEDLAIRQSTLTTWGLSPL